MGTGEVPMQLLLYTTSGCHLCELAAALLDARNLSYRSVDIADDDALFDRYGVRIPVLADGQGRELGWPFDADGLAAWLAATT